MTEITNEIGLFISKIEIITQLMEPELQLLILFRYSFLQNLFNKDFNRLEQSSQLHNELINQLCEKLLKLENLCLSTQYSCNFH